VGKNLSDRFPIRNGLKQGDALTPLLFIFALEWAIRRVQVNQDGLKLNRTHQLLAYADARRETTKINYGVDTRGKKKKRTSKKNVDGRCTSSHENKTFRSRSAVKQKGIVFGFRKTATAVTRPER
jgi:hypothetical protein